MSGRSKSCNRIYLISLIYYFILIVQAYSHLKCAIIEVTMPNGQKKINKGCGVDCQPLPKPTEKFIKCCTSDLCNRIEPSSNNSNGLVVNKSLMLFYCMAFSLAKLFHFIWIQGFHFKLKHKILKILSIICSFNFFVLVFLIILIMSLVCYFKKFDT